MEVITEGKVKTVYQGDDAEQVIIEYHDKVTAGNGEKEDHPLGKGSLCCSISSIIFEKLAKAHTLARDWLNKARRQASQDIEEGSIDDFMNRMG